MSQIEQGDPQAAEKLLPLVYDELWRLAAAKMPRENPGQTLSPTALVHEVYVRLAKPATASDQGRSRKSAQMAAADNSTEATQRCDHRGHFFAAAAEARRRILVETARRKARSKHEPNRIPVHATNDRFWALCRTILLPLDRHADVAVTPM